MYRNRYRKCCCQKNYNNDVLETICNSVGTKPEYCDNKNTCSCGFDENEPSVFPENPMLAQSYVPIQFMDKTFVPEVALKMGTIFPELVSPYVPGQSMEEIEYIRATNQIGEGCNR